MISVDFSPIHGNLARLGRRLKSCLDWSKQKEGDEDGHNFIYIYIYARISVYKHIFDLHAQCCGVFMYFPKVAEYTSCTSHRKVHDRIRNIAFFLVIRILIFLPPPSLYPLDDHWQHVIKDKILKLQERINSNYSNIRFNDKQTIREGHIPRLNTLWVGVWSPSQNIYFLKAFRGSEHLPLYKAYMGLMIKGPPSQGATTIFPMKNWGPRSVQPKSSSCGSRMSRSFPPRNFDGSDHGAFSRGSETQHENRQQFKAPERKMKTPYWKL